MSDDVRKDLVAKPLPFLFAWGLPLLAVFAVNFARDVFSLQAIVGIIAAAFLWMGLACLLNARRCRRRHCYYSGPIFLLGATALILIGFDLVPIGHEALNHVIWATFAGVALTFVSEWFWGKYVNGRKAS